MALEDRRYKLCSTCKEATDQNHWYCVEEDWWRNTRTRDFNRFGLYRWEPWMVWECGHNLDPMTRDGQPCCYYKVDIERYLKAIAEIAGIK